MKRGITGPIILAVWAAQSAFSADLDDRHLSVIPRTPAELASIARATDLTSDFTKPEPFEALPGGTATVPSRATADAFSQPSATMNFANELDFRAGNGLLSSPLFPDPTGDCTVSQPNCRNAPNGKNPGLRNGREVDQASLNLITHHSRNLAVSTRQSANATDVLAGKQVFYALGCPSCHNPKFATNRLVGQSMQSFKLIWPYTDLLLHDMGPDLADNRPEARATGREWHTPPLWGIGLTHTISGQASFLHDGRERTLSEAILWHGGEAAASRKAVIALSKADHTLIKFLESL